MDPSTPRPAVAIESADAPAPIRPAAVIESGGAATPTRPAASWGQPERNPLRKATPADLGALAGALADAFHDDPVFSWLIPDERHRRARLRRFYTIELRHV